MLKSQQFASEIQKWLKSRNIVFHIRNKVTNQHQAELDYTLLKAIAGLRKANLCIVLYIHTILIPTFVFHLRPLSSKKKFS